MFTKRNQPQAQRKKGDTEERLIHTDREKNKVQKVVVFSRQLKLKKVHAHSVRPGGDKGFLPFFSSLTN